MSSIETSTKIKDDDLTPEHRMSDSGFYQFLSSPAGRLIMSIVVSGVLGTFSNTEAQSANEVAILKPEDTIDISSFLLDSSNADSILATRISDQNILAKVREDFHTYQPMLIESMRDFPLREIRSILEDAKIDVSKFNTDGYKFIPSQKDELLSSGEVYRKLRLASFAFSKESSIFTRISIFAHEFAHIVNNIMHTENPTILEEGFADVFATEVIWRYGNNHDFSSQEIEELIKYHIGYGYEMNFIFGMLVKGYIGQEFFSQFLSNNLNKDYIIELVGRENYDFILNQPDPNHTLSEERLMNIGLAMIHRHGYKRWRKITGDMQKKYGNINRENIYYKNQDPKKRKKFLDRVNELHVVKHTFYRWYQKKVDIGGTRAPELVTFIDVLSSRGIITFRQDKDRGIADIDELEKKILFIFDEEEKNIPVIYVKRNLFIGGGLSAVLSMIDRLSFKYSDESNDTHEK